MKLTLFAILFLSIPSLQAKFNNESELTTIINGGNTEQETWNSKTLNTYLKNKNTYKLGGHYSYGKADDELNARNWDLNTRYERTLSEKWSAFSAIQREEDFFASLEYRWNYDLGGIYKFKLEKKQNLHFEAGYRRTLESDLEGRKTNGSKLRLYTEYSRQHNESLFYKLWVEALPNVSESDDWQVNFEPSLNLIMSKVFSLKLAYLHRYDNQPTPDSKKSDYQYTTSLIAKF
ncbi:MAG: DUF481 domain-containing protein [Halobacteriovoraceae bacterium]|nr:DUF481 domain-containing protein [Halobacteriovoraceae bacterium]